MTASQPEPVDILAFAPHPDDAELCAGGLLLKARNAGQRVVVVDMTRGEAGTRGTPATRAEEAAKAAGMLGLVARENLGLPDARVLETPEAIEAATRAIRTWRPKVVLSPCREDRHPDHIACAEIVRRAYYGATIEKGPGGPHPAHRPDVLMQYFGHLEPTPSFVVDISDVWEDRVALANCFLSQVSKEDGTPTTNIGSPDFEHRVWARFAYWGTRIGTRYGEPYLVDRLIPMDDPVATFQKRGWAVL